MSVRSAYIRYSGIVGRRAYGRIAASDAMEKYSIEKVLLPRLSWKAREPYQRNIHTDSCRQDIAQYIKKEVRDHQILVPRAVDINTHRSSRSGEVDRRGLHSSTPNVGQHGIVSSAETLAVSSPMVRGHKLEQCASRVLPPEWGVPPY